MAGVAVPPSDGDEPLRASDGEGSPSAGGTANGASREMAAFRRFQRYLQQQEQEEAPSPRRYGRRRRGDDEEEEDDGEGRGQSGPPPSWDGQTAFEDYFIKAKLWLATTKARGKARGPLLLKSLTSTPFETFKHLAKDVGWLSDPRGAERLLDEMNKPEFYGDDQQEHMLTALSRITYHMKRGKNETWREFFSRWDVALRRVHDHKISLPEEYEGFLMINGLQLTEMETKNMLNFTHGCIRPRSIKEWLRKNETKLSAAELGADRKKTNTNYLTEIEAHVLEEDPETHETEDPEIEELELYINDLLDPEETAENDILDENEAAEILSTILHKKKTYTQSLKSKKEKELSRGYGFQKGNGKGKYQRDSTAWPRSGRYQVSGNMTIEEIKRRTRCRRCQEVGHWKRECPNPPRPRSTDGKKPNETHYLANTTEAIFVGMLEHDRGGSSTDFVGSEFPPGPKSGLDSTTKLRKESECHGAYTESDQLGPGDCHELFHFENWFCEMVGNNNGVSIHEDTCATVDTGCQRLAIGSETLKKYMAFLPTELKVTLHPEINRFKSVHQISTTTRVATVPCALGSKGCFLRPAVFDCDQSEQAPFLMSLTFLLHCDTELRLSQEHGLHIRFRGSQETLPLHLGPTGALRIPLQQFSSRKVSVLQKTQEELHDQSREEFEVLTLNAETAHSNPKGITRSHVKLSELSQTHGALGEASTRQRREWQSRAEGMGSNVHEDLQGDGSGLQHDGPRPESQGESQTMGDEDGQYNGDGRPDLHPGVCQSADSEEGARDGQSRSGLLLDGDIDGTNTTGAEGDRRGKEDRVNNTYKLGESDADATNTFAGTVCDQHDHHTRSFGGEGRRCQGTGTSLWRDPAMPLRNGDQAPSEPQGRKELREDVLPLSPSHRETVPILRVDHLPALPRRGELQVQELQADGPDLCGSDAMRGTGSLPTQDHDQGGQQRLRGEGVLHGLQEGAEVRAQEDHEHQGQEGGRGAPGPGLRGVPEVSRVATKTEPVSEELHDLPPKTARKIKAAIQKAVSFWRQIQLILDGFQDETGETTLQKLMKDLNSEICQELSVRPGGTKRSREIAEIMGLNHQQLKTIAEIYNPGCFGRIAERYHLNAGRVFDITLGSDLRNSKTREEVKRYVRNVKPGLVLLAPPCRMYSQLQNLSKNKRETNMKLMNQYLQDRKEAQEMLEFAIEICQICLSLGIKFVLEHPYAASSWRQPKMQELLARDPVRFSRADQCQYGLRGSNGELHRKATGFATNDENIHSLLQRRCNGEHTHEHIIGGNRSKKSQEYPQQLIQCILQGYQNTVKEKVDLLTHEQMLMENYMLDEHIIQAWQQQGDEERRYKESGPDDSELPERDDGNRGRRFGIEGSDDYEQGRIQELLAAEAGGDDVEPEAGEGEPEVVAVDDKTQELPLQSRFSLKRLLQRAHEGLGHPSTDKFIRILRYSKAKPEVIAEARNLSCSVCRRHQQVRPARRSAPLRELEFNDCVGTDVVYLPLPNQKTRPALNIIDWATKFQLMIPLKAKKPAMVREAYRHWLRLFGPPKKIATDMGKEFKTDFLHQATADGSYVEPAAVEAPHQRGITERHGKTFKFMLMKAMDTYSCQTTEEWESLVDVTTMTKNRMLQTNGYSPIQRVLGFSPRLPGGLLSGDDGNRARPTLARLGDLSIERAMKMRKAASMAFIEADASDLLRRAVSTGPRPMEEYEIGEMVYFYRMGMDKAKKFGPGYWQGPARIVMMDQPSTLWLAHQGYLVKAAPERVRRASLEENLAVSGWLQDIVTVKNDLATEPKRGFVDLSEHPLPPVEDDAEDYTMTDEENEKEEPITPLRRYHEKEPIRDEDRRAHQRKKERAEEEELPETAMEELHPGEERRRRRDSGDRLPESDEKRMRIENQRFLEEYQRRRSEREPVGEDTFSMTESEPPAEGKRELETGDSVAEEQPAKKSRIEYLEIYHLKVENLLKSKQKKEIRLKEMTGKNYQCFAKAIITKEIKNNIDIGAYKILTLEESARVKQQEQEKIMDSRFVLTAKPLEPQDIEEAKATGLLLEWDADEPCKAKARHVMKGYSENGAEEIEAATPQVTREATLLVTQLIASHRWRLGFLDFTQAFHSGDKIERTIYATQPREGIPGLAEGQLLKLEKVCYGLTDGPLAWYRHLRRYPVDELLHYG